MPKVHILRILFCLALLIPLLTTKSWAIYFHEPTQVITI